MTTRAHDALVVERLASLRMLPAVKSGPSWLGNVAVELAEMTEYPIEKAERLIAAIGVQHGITTAGDARAARLAELAGIAERVSIGRGSKPQKATSPASTGNTERDARIAEISVAAKAVSRR